VILNLTGWWFAFRGRNTSI